jgi:hypothetical protein
MHSLIHPAYAAAVTAERVRLGARGRSRPRRHRPPPIRRHVAYAAGRIAGRLDAESARRAIA